jgi:hypothetical protein
LICIVLARDAVLALENVARPVFTFPNQRCHLAKWTSAALCAAAPR